MPTFDPASFTADSRKNWTDAAPFYDLISSNLFPPITQVFLEYCNLQRGHSVLDIACGPGTTTAGAVEKVAPNGSVLGIDLSPGMLEIARTRVPNARFQEMNAEALTLTDNTYDRTICQLGLMLFAKPKDAVLEMSRVVKPGGLVCCLVQGRAEKMLFTSLLMKTLVKHAPELKTPGAPTLYAFGTPELLAQAFADTCLEKPETKTFEGTFPFDSPTHYWETMTQGAGRTGAVLRSLPEATREAVHQDVLTQAAQFKTPNGLRIPYEVTLSRARKPLV